MPTKKPYIKAYLTVDEQAQVAAKAKQARLSISKFITAVCLAQEVRSTVDQQAVLALLHSKGDLGRLGGLLKHQLAETPHNKTWRGDLRALLRQVEACQKELAAGFDQVAQSLLKRKRG